MNTLKKTLEQSEKSELISIITHMLRQEPDNDVLLRVGHEMRSLTKQHGAAANDTRHCWQL